MTDSGRDPAENAPEPTTAAPGPGTQPFTTPAPDFTEAGVPTLDHVRDKIEGRYATALGASELAGESAEGRSVEEQMQAREKAAKERLEQLRRSLGDD